MNADVAQRRKAEASRPLKAEEFRASKTEIVTATTTAIGMLTDTESGLASVVEMPGESAARSNTLSTCPPDCATRLSGVVLGVCCEHMQIPAAGVAVGTIDLSVPLRAPTPATVADGRKYLADYQRCWPPPTFILLISLIEIGVFAFDYATIVASADAALANGVSVPSDSVFIYRPDRRLELWRFVSYMLLHANWFHLGFNVVIQLLFGVPLELVHGSTRVAGIYMAGVLAGSLGTSVVDSAVYLVGASGGVYALLAAHLSNVLMNFKHMRSGVAHLIPVAIFVVCDLGYALYCKYSMMAALQPALPSVSYVAHISGSLAGFTVGLLVLRSFDVRLQTRLVRWLALGACSAFTVFAIAFNLINTMTAQMLAEEEGEVIKEHLLHDFGIS